MAILHDQTGAWHSGKPDVGSAESIYHLAERHNGYLYYTLFADGSVRMVGPKKLDQALGAAGGLPSQFQPAPRYIEGKVPPTDEQYTKPNPRGKFK